MKKLIVVLFIIGVAASAHASEYGCKVLLCLANPASNGGPKGVSDCVPPIDQLYHDLGRGRPFPKCDQADGNDGSSYAREVYDAYDPCPAPLQPAVRGSVAVQGHQRSGDNAPGSWGGDGSFEQTGQPQVSEIQNDYAYSTGARACVGKQLGSYTTGTYDNAYTVNVFDKVLWQPAQNPRAIDVFVDRTWQQRVRY
ncbi:hypothetical protein AWB79_05014 [Caballeronia hypogeia]|uniref:Lipoprotein n=1 Tax=Caballeronia hypogeia TaxID=1777140 RepID=A0A158CCN3_9BURK|nr:hypothetical protein [Caballeronia hypogeia]SAK79277.1 hypothetical protein AWB79_05014 [Caballeronia hypogeia]